MDLHTGRRKIAAVMLFVVLFVTSGIYFGGTFSRVQAADEFKIPGKVTAAALNVRKKAGTSSAQVESGGVKVTLKKNQAVTILAETVSKGEKWYKVSFALNKKTIKGYVHSDYVALTLKKSVKAKVKSSSAVKIRTGAGTGKAYLKVKNKVVSLKNGTACTILKETSVSGKKWFQIQFKIGSKTYKGYLPAEQTAFAADTPEEIKTGKVRASSLNVRKAAGTDQEILMYNGKSVKLPNGTAVTIQDEKKVGEVIWYKVGFAYDKTILTGFVSGDYVVIDKKGTAAPKPTAEPSQAPEPTDEPELTDEPEPTDVPSETPVPTTPPLETVPLSDAEFEQSLTEQGFPEDYKTSLRMLHAQYPMWQFRANITGLDWNEVIANESRVGVNLITNSKSIAWKSLASGAYNWAADKFIPYDGSTWVTASKEALEYYMDPRNFLTTDGIFQYELLSYNSLYQNKAGVESILKGTALGGSSYNYTDAMGMPVTTTYGDTFISAAEYSNVNPYHLATRVKQEVVTSATGLSSSVSGTIAGYEGLYNFYNIGATHSTAAGGSVANGLDFALNGKGMNGASQALYLLPWNNHYNAIVGGAKYIGSNYINRGQDTVYLQKFNITDYSRYSHQYMANVEAAKSEAQKIYTAYKNISDVPVVFNIPVYNNMPLKACPIPSGGLNPNNWLKTLAVEGYTLTPTFNVNNPVDTTYTLIVDNSVSAVIINAAAVSSKAMVSGGGTIPLNTGINTVTINVTAENGDIRPYTIDIYRN